MKPRVLAIGWFWALLLPGLATAMVQEKEKPLPSRRPELWAIIVGIGDYRDPAILDSQTATEQAGDVLKWFRAAGWDESHQLLLRDFGSSDPGAPEAPAPNILPKRANLDWAIQQWLLPKAKQGDMVVFYFAGRASAVMTPRGSQIEPRVDYYLLPIDASQANTAATGWSLDRAVDDCARRRIQVVCWLATTVEGRSMPAQAPPPIARPINTPNPTGQDWLRRLARWPGVTAWLAADRPLGIGENTDILRHVHRGPPAIAWQARRRGQPGRQSQEAPARSQSQAPGVLITGRCATRPDSVGRPVWQASQQAPT